MLLSTRHGYFLRSDDRETEVPLGLGRSDAGSLEWHPRAIASRGALDSTFRQDLYAEPYGRGFYDGFVATSGDLPVDEGSAGGGSSGGGSGAVAGTVVGGPAPERISPRHRSQVGYLLSGAPAGNTGLSQGIDLRYGYRFWGPLDLGVAAQLGHGAGALNPMDTTQQQQLTRVAVMLTLGAEWRPVERLGLRLDGAGGWVLLSGLAVLGTTALVGTEPRGFRAEFGGGVNVRLAGPFGIYARGGLALDGVYPAPSPPSFVPIPSSFSPSGFFNAGVQFSL
jgi:hypothetical protein